MRTALEGLSNIPAIEIGAGFVQHFTTQVGPFAVCRAAAHNTFVARIYVDFTASLSSCFVVWSENEENELQI